MESVDGQHDQTMLWGNLATAIAYFVITSQLLLFVLNPKVSERFHTVIYPAAAQAMKETQTSFILPHIVGR